MKNGITYLLLALAAAWLFVACGSKDGEGTPADNFDVQFKLPASIDVAKGGEYTFEVITEAPVAGSRPSPAAAARSG